MEFKISPIKNDASFRSFFRLSSKKKNKIIILAKKEKYKNLVAYTAINKFLRKKGILAPKLYTYNLPRGIVIIEDFGALSFHKVLNKKKNRLVIYKKLVDLLIKIQKIKPRLKLPNIGSGSYRVDKYTNRYLFRESNLFFDWYLPLFLNKKKSLNIKIKSNKILLKIYNKLNFPNSHFVHRDFHSENLMKVGKKVGVIDSQDALIGNPAYDLVSLIDDVRIKTSRKLKDQVLKYYLKKTSKIYRIKSKKFLEDFKILSVQRSLKIIGIFSRLYLRDKKDRYLKYIPYTWKLLEMRMDEKIFYELKKILNSNIKKKMRKKFIYK